MLNEMWPEVIVCFVDKHHSNPQINIQLIMKRKFLNSDNQQFNKYQQNKQSLLATSHLT
jgi:hypothetical protein